MAATREASVRAAGPRFQVYSWTELQQMLRGIKALGPRFQEKGLREHKEDGAVFSAQQEARICLIGARPLPRVQQEPLWGNQCSTHSSWCCLPRATSGQDVGLSRTGASKDPRIQGLGAQGFPASP